MEDGLLVKCIWSLSDVIFILYERIYTDMKGAAVVINYCACASINKYLVLQCTGCSHRVLFLYLQLTVISYYNK